jgi:hypothetical protein
LAISFEQRIGLDIGVVVHRLVARRRHHEADHAFFVAELLNGPVGGFGIVEGQIKHGDQPRLGGENALAEPAVIALRHRHLDLDLRMQAEEQHRGRKQAGVIDPHGVHPQLGHADVAVGAGGDLLVFAQFVARDAAAGVLIADLAVEERRPARPFGRFDRGAADHRVVDILEQLFVGFVFIMVGVHIDDEEILVVALARLGGCMLQMLGDRELVEPQVADLRAWHVHGVLLYVTRPRRYRRRDVPRRTCAA